MIPDDAVEAAARATQEVCETYDPGGWTEEENWAIWARQILEAGAPHMLAEAWGAGARAQAAAYGMDKDTGPNPYEAETE